MIIQVESKEPPRLTGEIFWVTRYVRPSLVFFCGRGKVVCIMTYSGESTAAVIKRKKKS